MITIIFGDNGAGKTCLGTYIANERAFDRERNRAMQAEIRHKNANGFNLTVPQHCVATNYKVVFRKIDFSPRYPRIINPYRLGFQNGAPYKMHYTLPYESIFIDEAQKYFPSREQNFPTYRSNYFEENRHNSLDIYLMTPDAILIHKNVRRLAQGIKVVDRKVTVNKYGSMKITWTVHRILTGYIDKYLDAPPKEQKQYYTKEKIVADYNVYRLYDSQGCKYRFVEGHIDEDFDLSYSISSPITKDDYINYINALDDSKPEEDKKK